MPLLAKPALMFLVEAAATTLSDLCGHPEGRTYAPVFQALAGIEGAAGRWRGIEPTKQCQSGLWIHVEDSPIRFTFHPAA